MVARGVYTRSNLTTTREVIHVSTAGHDRATGNDSATGNDRDPATATDTGGVRRDTGDSSARTAVQLDPDLAMAVRGTADADLHVRGGTMTISGDPPHVDRASRVVSDLLRQARRGVEITPASVRRSVEILADSGPLTPEEVLGTDVLSRRGGMIRPKTLGQKRYVDAIDDHTIVFGLGPAGTGKTYLAMAKAVAALRAKEVSRIILTRPAVEAGERLGYLPGTLHEKIDPYLRPLYDSLHDMMDTEAIPKLMAAGVI